MKLTISAVDTVHFGGTAESVTVPAIEGEITVLSHHMPLVTTLRAGTITVKANGQVLTFPVVKGLIDIGTEETVILLSN
jgi:F-type H+-transporting ATPase subunit epsilon